jgi:hypothetical protein
MIKIFNQEKQGEASARPALPLLPAPSMQGKAGGNEGVPFLANRSLISTTTQM